MSKVKIRVGIIFGGLSVEHEVSIISALQVIESADASKYAFIPIYISKKGKWYSGDELKRIDNYKDLDKLLTRSNEVYLNSTYGDFNLYPMDVRKKKKIQEIDIFFPVLHGGTGEDGSIQGLFELKGCAYVNNDVISSSISMNKLQVKRILMNSSIPVVDHLEVNDKEWFGSEEQVLKNTIDHLSFPVIVKPVNLGSSIGIKLASDEQELYDAIDSAFQYSGEILIEKAIQNLREINCSVFGDTTSPQCSELEEPIMKGDILSFEDKYMSDSSENQDSGMASLDRIIPAQLPKELAEKIKKYSLDAFQLIGCSGIVRIDYLIDDKSQEVFLNEINAIPGSLAFYLWEPKGKPYKELIDELIDLGFKKWYASRRYKLTTNYNLFNIVGGKKNGK